MIVYVMGVSGSGKSTIGRQLAHRLCVPFADGDDYHPIANKEKMAGGTPLDDEDRKPWLQAINRLALETQNSGKSLIIACSALKSVYRDWLTEGLQKGEAFFVLLEGSHALIAERLQKRQPHFMNPNLLNSQFATLEDPANAIRVTNDRKVDEVVSEILTKLTQAGAQTREV